MATSDLNLIDASKPDGATETGAVLDNYAREHRTALKAWAGIEHDLKGRHKFSKGGTRPVITGDTPAVDGTIFFNTNKGRLEIYDSVLVDWIPLIVQGDSYAYNGSFEKWVLTAVGGHNTPAGWTRSASQTLTRNTTAAQVQYGSVSLEFARAGSDLYVSQILTSFWDLDIFKDEYVTIFCKARASVASIAHVGIDTGSGFTWSSTFAGTGAFDTLRLTVKVPSGATKVEVAVAIRTTNGTVQFDGVTVVLGYGQDNYKECTYPLRTTNLSFGSGTLSAATSNHLGLGFGTFINVSIAVEYRALVRRIGVLMSTADTIDCILYSSTDEIVAAGDAVHSWSQNALNHGEIPTTPRLINADEQMSVFYDNAGISTSKRVSVDLEEVPL
jgi:hypothetical protein